MNETTTEIAIQGTGLTKTFGEGATAYQALRGVDISVNRGEFIMMSGPSGSGKTTLLSIMGCVLTATTGNLQLLDTVVSGTPERKLSSLRLAYIGFIFQGHNLIASLSAQDNVALMLEMRGWARGKALIEAGQLLERVGLGDKLKNKPGDMSGGQRQRVAIARAVAGDPPIILADEPTASLDAKSGLLVMELLKDLAKQQHSTVVVVTHDNRIYHLADRILHIEDGQFRKDHSS